MRSESREEGGIGERSVWIKARVSEHFNLKERFKSGTRVRLLQEQINPSMRPNAFWKLIAPQDLGLELAASD